MLFTLSLIFLAILLYSIFRPHINPGLLALATTYIALPLLPPGNPSNTAQLFPTSLFLTLLGVTLFFACLNATGLIENILQIILRRSTSRPKLVAAVLFLIVSFLTASGLGNIATVALIAPIAIPLASELKIPKLAMTILIVGGANAASFSPLCLPGIVIHDFIAKGSIAKDFNSYVSFRWMIFWGVFLSISVITWASFFLLKAKKMETNQVNILETPPLKFPQSNKKFSSSAEKKAARVSLILAFIFILANVISALKDQFILSEFFGIMVKTFSNVSLISWLGAVLLLLLNATTLDKALSKIPWTTILMVTGMSTFIELLTHLGLAHVLSQAIKTNVPEFLLPSVFASSSALLSAFSSSVGVALPTFLPLAEAVTQATPNSNAQALLLSLAVGSHLVDASPLSTLGALCLAQIQTTDERSFIYKWLLIYSFLMIPVSAILAIVFTTMI